MPPGRNRRSRSCLPRRHRSTIPGCSRTSCRYSPAKPASRCTFWRRAPVRRSMTAAHGDADLVLVHDPEAEQKFVAARPRHRPPADCVERFHPGRPDAPIRRMSPAATTRSPRCRRSPRPGPPFVSRGDNSGTDALETGCGRPPRSIRPRPVSGWYRDIGGGMGAALNAAQAMGAYTISDRGTWLGFGNKARSEVAGRRRSATAEPLRRDPARS